MSRSSMIIFTKHLTSGLKLSSKYFKSVYNGLVNRKALKGLKLMSSKRKPILASGTIVSDYEPLFKYWELAKSRNKKLAEKATLRSEDFDTVLSYVSSKGVVGLIDLLSYLEEYMLNRVDGQLAVRALKEIYGVMFEVEEAKHRIARILAGWLIEACNLWGTLKLTGKSKR